VAVLHAGGGNVGSLGICGIPTKRIYLKLRQIQIEAEIRNRDRRSLPNSIADSIWKLSIIWLH
jgi:hypothetical protein